MTMTANPLFQPFSIKSLNLKNRFVLAPISRYSSINERPTEELAAFHSRRARGGAGLTITGGTAVDRPAANNHPNLACFRPHTFQAWQHVVDEVHDSGGPIALQLWHAGSLYQVKPDWKPVPVESPSGILASGEPEGTAMTDEDIADTISAFARGAEKALEIGFDAVEIHAAHGFLLDEFFWDVTNRRNDRWGGKSLAGRTRFVSEVLHAVRSVLKDETPLFIRISQWKEQDPDTRLAHSPQELEEWLGPLVDAGVDIFDCSQRRYWEPEFSGSDLNFAGWVKKVTGKPTITVGSVGLDSDIMEFIEGKSAAHRPVEELLRRFERGDFDLVAVGRAMLADPEWIVKLRDERLDEMETVDPDKFHSWK
jgi:2,4-dienoyl-CoA reductase-like NADH-dependent reductase (Old Yellow Enzyme family)